MRLFESAVVVVVVVLVVSKQEECEFDSSCNTSLTLHS